MFENGRQAILVSAGCTTGWTDWVHGELWMRSDGLLRVRSGWRETRTHGRLRSVYVPDRPVMELEDEMIRAVAKAHPTNRWVAKGDIRQARFHGGITTSRLLIRRHDGESVKLLWLKADGGSDLLGRWLGKRFIID